MIKALIFDFWGTLVENGVKSPTKQVKQTLGIRMPFPEYVTRMERAMMTKQFPALKEAFQSVCREFAIDCPEQVLEELVGLWNASWMLAKPYDEVQEVLSQLHKKYRLILISNTDASSIHHVLDKFSLQGFFERILLSCDLGMIKTDKNFLKTVLTESNIAMEDCLLIGDSIQSDIIPAQRIGMKTILIDRHGKRDFSPKINNLQEIEMVITRQLW